MNTSMLKSTLAAAAVSLTLLVPAARAQDRAPEAGVGNVIAAQGNAALRQIREEMKSAVRAARPVLPARPTMVTNGST
jgi:hypothetical protein